MTTEKLHDKLGNGLLAGVSPSDIGVIVQAARLAHDAPEGLDARGGRWLEGAARRTEVQVAVVRDEVDLCLCGQRPEELDQLLGVARACKGV